jgi:hypothetical protein
MPTFKNNKVAYGKNMPLCEVFNKPIIARRAPRVNDRAAQGQIWINKVDNTVWICTSYLNGNCIWTSMDSAGATGLTWITTASAAFNAAVNHGYALTNNANITVTLPAVAPVGSVIYLSSTVKQIVGSALMCQAQAGQTITLYIATSGILGRASMTIAGEQSRHLIELLCTVADTQWRIVNHSSPVQLT